MKPLKAIFINTCSQNSQTQQIGYLASSFFSAPWVSWSHSGPSLHLVITNEAAWSSQALTLGRLSTSFASESQKYAQIAVRASSRVSTRMFQTTWACLVCPILLHVLRVVATWKSALLAPGMARSWNTSSKQHTPSVASLTQCKCKFEITTHQPHIHWSQLHISLNLANQRFSPSITCQKCTNSEYPLTKKSCSKQDLSRIAPAIQARHEHGVHNARRTTLYTDCRAHRQKAPTVCMH